MFSNPKLCKYLTLPTTVDKINNMSSNTFLLFRNYHISVLLFCALANAVIILAAKYVTLANMRRYDDD